MAPPVPYSLSEVLQSSSSSQQQHEGYSAETVCVWPPVVCTQTPAMVEVQLGVTRTATHTSGVFTGGTGSPAVAHMLTGSSLTSPLLPASPASSSSGISSPVSTVNPLLKHQPSQPASLLTVSRDTVAAAEPVALAGRGVQSFRVRVSEQEPTVLSFLVGDEAGVPSFASIKAPGLLPVLPSQACSEMRALLWLMMHEVLAPDSPTPAMEPEVFCTTLSQLPISLQRAAAWAWGSHFRHLAADINYCMDFMPDPGSKHEQDFRAILCNLTAFLRDHDAWATLACLLASCAARGCVLLSASSPLSAKDLSPACLAAMNCPGFPWSPRSPVQGAAASVASHATSMLPSPSRRTECTPDHHACTAEILPFSPDGSEGLPGMGFSKLSDPEQHAASAPASPRQRLAAYLRMTCCGWGLWAEEVVGGESEWLCSKSSSMGCGDQATAHRELWCVGSLVAMALMAVAWCVTAFTPDLL